MGFSALWLDPKVSEEWIIHELYYHVPGEHYKGTERTSQSADLLGQT